jgi:predicted amidophosphoribosyltransferase
LGSYDAPESTPTEVDGGSRAPGGQANMPPAIPRCSSCGGTLPLGRTVSFCPHCGESQTRSGCPECQGQLEPGWRYCVGCGLPVVDA